MIAPLDGSIPQLPAPDRTATVGAAATPPAEASGAGVSLPGNSGMMLPGAPASDRGYALAMLLAAIAVPPETSAPFVGEDVAAVLGRAARTLPLVQAAVVARLLQPLAGGLSGADLREALRERVEASGVFFEARLRLALQALPAASTRELLGSLPPDIRVLLAEIVRRTRGERPVVQPAPTDEQTSAIGEQTSAIGDPASAIGDPLTSRARVPARNAPADPFIGRTGVPPVDVPPVDEPARRAAAEAVLRQQAEVAYRWLHEGTFAVEFPVRLPTEEARVFVEFQREGRERGGEQPNKESVLRIHVESRVFGCVAVEARWGGGSCDARFFVADAAACTALQNEAESLRAALTPVFARASVQVIVDSGRAVRREPGRRPDPPPGGSLLSVRT